jgi:hypothetical protein
MKRLPNWNMSHESARRFSTLLDKAAKSGIDPDAVRGAGLAAWRALAALESAGEAAEGPGRDRLLTRAEDALRAVDPKFYGELSRQIQIRLLALRGRRGDEDIAHVTEGELIVPKSLQTADVLTALQAAATEQNVPFDRLRVGSKKNAVNPATGLTEFADPLGAPTEEIKITADRSKFIPRPGDEEMLARMMFAEGAGHYRNNPEFFAALGWSAVNRIGRQGLPKEKKDLQGVITAPRQFSSVNQTFPDGRSSLWDLAAEPDKLTGPNKAAYEAARETARGILSGEIADPTGGAHSFHSSPQTPPGFQRSMDEGLMAPFGKPIGPFKFFGPTS